ncbi:MAG TPA: VWA domain-containing protein [Candidatus Acidoferrales bacterium]|jgi:Ca-activated chloride channel family protein|nr:VWA domain-containing protein [Candidatus Acidoferrales bacterium]
MSFDRPGWLLAGLAGIVAFMLVYRWFSLRKTSRDLAYSNIAFFVAATKPRPWIPAVLTLLWILSLGGIALALGGPHLVLPVPARDGSVFICIDTSGSMASTDIVPTRADAAKSAARTFIAASPAGTKIGIIAFSGAAGIVQPLSADHEAVSQSLDQVPLPNGATAIGDALQLAARNLPPKGNRVIILITDGVNNAGADPSEIAQYLGAHHIPIYTIGIGTNSGEIIPGTNQEATIDEDALRSYAQASGGAYARVETASQLRDALGRLGRMTTIERKHVDASLEFAIAGAIGMIVAFFAGFGLGRYP